MHLYRRVLDLVDAVLKVKGLKAPTHSQILWHRQAEKTIASKEERMRLLRLIGTEDYKIGRYKGGAYPQGTFPFTTSTPSRRLPRH